MIERDEIEIELIVRHRKGRIEHRGNVRGVVPPVVGDPSRYVMTIDIGDKRRAARLAETLKLDKSHLDGGAEARDRLVQRIKNQMTRVLRHVGFATIRKSTAVQKRWKLRAPRVSR